VLKKLQRYTLIALFLIGINSLYLGNIFITVAEASDPNTGLPGDPNTGLPGNPNTSLPGDPNTSPPATPNTTLPSPYDRGKIGNICDLINQILNIIAELGAIVAVLFILWSGFLFITAQGNKEKVTQAKNTFITTIVGTAILLGASVIAKIIFNTVTAITTSVSEGGGICAKGAGFSSAGGDF
jgi:hypothetical protein